MYFILKLNSIKNSKLKKGAAQKLLLFTTNHKSAELLCCIGIDGKGSNNWAATFDILISYLNLALSNYRIRADPGNI